MAANVKQYPCVKKQRRYEATTFEGGREWQTTVDYLLDRKRSGQITLHVDPQGKIGDVDWTEAK